MTSLTRLRRDAEQIAGRFSHVAIALSALLHDDRDEETGALRDLEPHEERFLIAVHRITTARARAIGEARRAGIDGKAMLEIEHHSLAIMNAALDSEVARLDAAADQMEAA